MSAAEILKLIETVDPFDSTRLDEIDARVWVYLTLPNDGLKVSFNGGTVYYRYDHWDAENRTVLHHPFQHPQYTKSRDALKAIRPSETVPIKLYTDGHVVRFELLKRGTPWVGNRNIAQSDWLPTEELAELHAIIQAIEYERTQNAT